jgi:hypothetical protein
MTVAVEDLNCSEISATAVTLSALAMHASSVVFRVRHR